MVVGVPANVETLGEQCDTGPTESFCSYTGTSMGRKTQGTTPVVSCTTWDPGEVERCTCPYPTLEVDEDGPHWTPFEGSRGVAT